MWHYSPFFGSPLNFGAARWGQPQLGWMPTNQHGFVTAAQLLGQDPNSYAGGMFANQSAPIVPSTYPMPPRPQYNPGAGTVGAAPAVNASQVGANMGGGGPMARTLKLGLIPMGSGPNHGGPNDPGSKGSGGSGIAGGGKPGRSGPTRGGYNGHGPGGM